MQVLGCPCVASTAGLVCNRVAPQSNWLPRNILKTPGKNLHVVGGNRESPFVALRLACGQLEGRCVPGGLCIRAAGSGSCSALCERRNGPVLFGRSHQPRTTLELLSSSLRGLEEGKGKRAACHRMGNMIKTPATSSFSGHAIHT